MKYSNVCIEAFTYTLPEEVLTTDELERQLAPLYERLKLPAGRLEILTGIKERRLWQRGTTPGTQSIKTVKKLLTQTGFDPMKAGALIHGSVCRDFLEPATACRVHYETGLSSNCFVYDVSNACLGIMSGIIQIADKIELGQIEAGIVVGTEDSRALIESTVRQLNTDETFTRKSVKPAFASLTIGSGSAAVLLTHKNCSRTGRRLLGGSVLAKTNFHNLCQSDGMNPTMQTDSETLMLEGVTAAKENFEKFLDAVQWKREDIAKTFCHQVGKMHQKLLFETLGLPPEINFSTLETLGNTGSVALPTAAAIGIETGFAKNSDRIALMGIGSGINVVMLGLD
ncbi:MAG: 3-oxoacyl-ACP synthase III [Planctomycetaceae bacterium]|jgi:3-oxoacyl-[acyl-carrier-protein] synthase-3|nr:3-oxoacyl-ACP synthase III [Planctomycetaceae bacterium]